MPYTPNNPLVPGDPYSYDLKWMVEKLKELTANYTGLNQEVINIKNYLNSLDVETFVDAKIDQMYADGQFTSILQSLVDSYVATTNARIDNIESDIALIASKLLAVRRANAFREEAAAFPLYVIKAYVNGISGDEYNVQGMCATYNADDSIKNIYVYCDAGSHARLYKLTGGNRTNGSGWTYSYSDNVPAVHGSTISVNEAANKIYISNEAGSGTFYEYDIVTDTYALIDISNITNTPILGVVYDSDTNTFLVCGNINNKMYVLDDSFALIREYSHNITYDTSSYLYQSYDYKNGLEYRTFNGPQHRTNGIIVYDTIDGTPLKLINIGPLYGELESISIRNGVALLAYDNVYYDYNNIQMGMVAEAYIGGAVNTNFMLNIRQKINCGYPFANFLSNHNTTGIPNIYYVNTHADSELCRYVGVGTTANPISSGLVIAAMILLFKQYYDYSKITITLNGDNTNDDDNGFWLYDITGIDLIIIGNDKTLNNLYVHYANNLDVRAIAVTAGGTGRRANDGRMYLEYNNNLIIKNTVTAPIVWLTDNYRVLIYNTLTGTHASINSESYRNIYMPGSKAKFTAPHFVSNGDISS